jgi:putative PIN family toxin of toxin-antitoxin system
MPRIVADTNVLVSATLVKEGASNRILQAWKEGEVELITSPVLLEELEEVLKRPRIRKYQWMTAEEIQGLLQLLNQTTVQTSGRRLVEVIPEDPDDDFVLSAAKEGIAEFIVSGDQHLLSLKEWESIPILTPKAFLEVLE